MINESERKKEFLEREEALRSEIEEHAKAREEIKQDIKKYKSVKSKMIAIIGGGITIALFLFFIASMKVAKIKIKEQMELAYGARAEYLSSEVDTIATKDATLLDVEIAAVSSIDQSKEYATLEFVLTNLTSSYDEVGMCYVGMTDGSLYNGSGWLPPEGWDCRTRSWFTDAVALGGKNCYSTPYVDSNTGDILVTVSKYFKTSSFEGVAAIDLTIGQLFSTVSDTAKSVGYDDDYVFIAAADGSMVWHPNAEFNSTPEKIVYSSDLVDSGYTNAEATGEYFTDYNGNEATLKTAVSPVTGWKTYYVSPSLHLTDSLKVVQNQLFIVFVIFCIIIDVMIWFVGVAITSQMRKASDLINKFVQDIKSGNGDLTTRININDKNETGQMVDCVNTLIETLGGVISEINTATNSLVEDVESLRSAAEDTNDNITSISATMEEMSAGTEETSASTNMVAQQVGDIAQLTADVNAGTKAKTAEIGRSIDDVAKNITAIKDRDARMLERLYKAIDDLHEKIAATKKVEEIKQMTAGISNVASQTNLLSLNASIEAARAGDAGRGFAVVASEIGSLANDSAQMAKSIEEVSNEVLAIVEQLVKSAESVSAVMMEISKQNSEEKSNILTEYDTSLHNVLNEMQSIAESSDEISTAISGIKDAISAIDVAVNESTDGITQVATNASELVKVVDGVSRRAESVAEVSELLKAEVGRFKF